MEKDAEKFSREVRALYPNEEDRILFLNLVLAHSLDSVSIGKVQSHGQPELIACKKLNLRWNGHTIHGADARDCIGRGVELKTYKRVQNSNRVNVMYTFPPRQKNESDVDYRKRVVNHYLTDEKFTGGHFWVAFNQEKTQFLRSNFVSREKVAAEIDAYLKKNPTSKSKNFGGALCAVCHRCHNIDIISGVKNETCRLVK